jgi:NAD-dependent oxidoreductase involved in siderophore biosynthesis
MGLTFYFVGIVAAVWGVIGTWHLYGPDDVFHTWWAVPFALTLVIAGVMFAVGAGELGDRIEKRRKGRR